MTSQWAPQRGKSDTYSRDLESLYGAFTTMETAPQTLDTPHPLSSEDTLTKLMTTTAMPQNMTDDTLEAVITNTIDTTLRNQRRTQPQIAPYTFQEFSFDEPLYLKGVPKSEPQKTPLFRNNSSQTALKETPMMTKSDCLSYDRGQDFCQKQPTELPKGGIMVDLTGYKDLTEAPSDEENGAATATALKEHDNIANNVSATLSQSDAAKLEADLEVEYTGNVKTLVQLVNDLPDGVTKQTGAQIIRLTMEAMGISMETVLTEAQSAQSELLDAVRTNIKKIEEYKTIIRKLETEIRFHQGKANELSEIIDLFILSNKSPVAPSMDSYDDEQSDD